DLAIDAGTVNGSGSFTTTNTVTKNTASAASVQITLNNAGAFSVNGGSLDLSAGGNNSGAINVSPGATLAFSGGGFLLSAGTSLGGIGIYNLTGSGFLDPQISIACPTNFLQDGSSVLNNGPNTFTIGAGSTYKWQGGQIFSGTTTLNGGSL